MKPTPYHLLLHSAQKSGWFVVCIGFLGFLGWASLYPIDQGIPGTGYLISKAERVQVISPTTGLVSRLAKHAGDNVNEGDVLLEFDIKILEANERGIKESIQGLETSNATLRSALDSRNEQIFALRSQFDSSLKLVDSGFASINSLAIIKTQLSLAESEAFELKSRIEQNDYRLRELKHRIAGVRHEIELSKILAPTSGKLMNTSIKSSGVNITAGTQIMEIVPDSESLVIDARIPVDFATLTHTGMAVDVLFPTLPGSSTVRIKGTLVYLSADRLVDTRTNQIYLEGRISLNEQTAVDHFNLRAGLPATVLLNTGPRTLLSYITRPLTERVAKGLQ